jgi:hypothetical protein
MGFRQWQADMPWLIIRAIITMQMSMNTAMTTIPGHHQPCPQEPPPLHHIMI